MTSFDERRSYNQFNLIQNVKISKENMLKIDTLKNFM
jgi:hypothetical protein